MNVLNHLMEAAAIILLLELLVVLLIFLGVAGGLAFGLHWVRGKTGPVFARIHHFVGLGTAYVDKGLGYAALPVTKAAALAETVRVTALAIRERVRQGGGEPASPPPPVAATLPAIEESETRQEVAPRA